MRSLTTGELREEFLKFYEGKAHLRLPSFSLIPYNDKSVLLINAGMTPMKPFFTGQEKPPSLRVTTCQKCVRTVDIDIAGLDGRHVSFIEMLGNFSFGDYFKEEAIAWAWEFITEKMEMPVSKLYISIYLDDDEAFEIWNKKIGVPSERIYRLGKKDNFWEHGAGPCGPSSEIHFDRGPEYGCGKEDCQVGCDCDRYMEVWNLVFIQFERSAEGEYSELEFKSIDTGCGLERLAIVVQGRESVFDIDSISGVRDAVAKTASYAYGSNEAKDVSVRLIADHIRVVTFLTADGLMPSNEERGYVLRRVLRRAARHGKLLGIKGAFLSELCDSVIEVSGPAYPELREKRDYIKKMVLLEENRFQETLDQGLGVLNEQMRAIRESGGSAMPGGVSFRLYDTFGFPVELTEEILAENGFSLDRDGFDAEMEKQKARARSARAQTNYMGADASVYDRLDNSLTTEFVGYSCYKCDSLITALIAGGSVTKRAEEGESVSVILERTPFYAESGGQAGDSGVISTSTGTIKVTGCQKTANMKTVHTGTVVSGRVENGSEAVAEIDREGRASAARNHSATHLLQKSLRTEIGAHVEQAGSFVNAERLRFDFSHFEAIPHDKLLEIEDEVNRRVLDAMAVNVSEKNMDEAKEMGAVALFGEKYGQTVRVVDMGGYSVELCGGTHVNNTSEIGTFKILSESGIAAGVRRIEAVTGKGALAHYRQTEETLRSAEASLKTTRESVPQRIRALLEEHRKMHQEMGRQKSRSASDRAEEIISRARNINGFNVIAAKADGLDIAGLRDLSDKIRGKVTGGVIALAGVTEEKVDFLVIAMEDAVKAGANAGALAKAAAQVCGGGGGGRPNMAQAGGPDVSKTDAALEKIADMLQRDLA